MPASYDSGVTVALALEGAEVTGLDTSEPALGDPRDRAEAGGARLTPHRADIEQALPFPDQGFDAVVSRLVLVTTFRAR